MSGRDPDHVVRRPVNYQTWQQLTFLHWRYDAATVQPLLPDGLTVQEWDGATWVGVTPFRMSDVRAPGLPPPPGWGAFPELNVRAYVRDQHGRDGIWFLGMLVPRASFLATLRSLGLPYELSNCETDADERRWSYRFGTPGWLHRRGDRWFTAQVEVGQPLAEQQRTPLLDSVTGRWWAYHRRARVLWHTPVEHQPWPLHHATVTGDLTAPLLWSGLPEPAADPMTHAAPAVHARFGPARPVGTRRGLSSGNAD